MDIYIGFAKMASIPSFIDLEKNKYEYVMPFYRLFVMISKVPNWLKKILVWILRKFTSEQRLANRLHATRNRNYHEINALHQDRDAWRANMDKKWKEQGIDGLISPLQYHCAFKNEFKDLGMVHDYMLIWNFVSFPAGCVPITTVREDEAKGTYI